jgi:energy-coupling factor transport system permease protein
MRLLEPIADPAAPLARRNPLAKLIAALGLALLLIAAADPVTPALALGVELAVVPLAGIRYGVLLWRMLPLLIGSVGVFATTLVFTTHRAGAVVASLGPVGPLGPFEVTTGSLDAALGLSVRLLALALPGLLAMATTDPTDLADALIQHARVSPRFAIGALAALRLAPLLVAEWQALTLARRARGIDAGWSPVARLRLFGGTTFALLVGAIRRGTRIATAMDARGFDAGLPRTVARRQHLGAADAALVVGAIAVSAAAVATSVALGTFRPLFG